MRMPRTVAVFPSGNALSREYCRAYAAAPGTGTQTKGDGVTATVAPSAGR